MDYSFGIWIKRRRKALDLTQHELADRVGCSPSAIFKIEADERRPSRQIAELLAAHLEIPTDQRPLFLKIARQEKGIQDLAALSPLQKSEPGSDRDQNKSNLPISPTPLIGREHEVSMVIQQLQNPSCRLVTLTGPGGVGKTRLALEVAHQLETKFKDGVYFLSMAGISLTESLIPSMADVMGIVFSGPADTALQLTNHLRERETLFVIDNFEHLLSGGSILVQILQQAPKVKMLLTSREQIHLQWEWVFEVQGLPIPEELVFAALENNSATALFIQRARQISHTFSPHAEDTSALLRICKLVDGLPLAIELAASWVRVLSCREIADELERSLDILETKNLDVPERHRSVKTVFDHSWTLLTDEERNLLKRLSVFQGGFTREAAIAAMGAFLPIISSLVDKSLLRHNRNPDRYDLHELIRQYAFAQLQSDPNELFKTCEKFAVYYAHWIAALEAPFKSANQPQTTQQIRAETSNWQFSWHWAIKNQRLDLLRKKIACLNWYFEVHGYYDEALSIFSSAVDGFRINGAPTSLNSAEEKTAFAFLVDSLGWFEFRTGNVEQATALLSESLELAREQNDPEVLYYIYGNWGYLSLFKGEVTEAIRLTSESLFYGKVLNSPWHTAIPISVLGITAYQLGNLEESLQQLTESLKIWRTVGDPRGMVFCMLYLGMTTFALNDIDATRTILEESNQIAEANMDRWAHAFGLDMLGMIALSLKENEDALTHFNQSHALYKEIGDQLNSTQTIVHKGQAYTALNENAEAKRLFLEANATAQNAKWTPIILNALVSFIEMQNGLSAVEKYAVVSSVLSHSAITPHLRARCERLREELLADLTKNQIEAAENLAKEKKPEVWAQEILK